MSVLSIQEQVETVFQTIRPSIEMHGGNIEYVSYENGVLAIRFLGACVSCPISTFTLKLGIEEAIKAAIPEIKEVVAIDE